MALSVIRDNLPVACVVGLYALSHLLPAFKDSDDPGRRVYYGWQVSLEAVDGTRILVTKFREVNWGVVIGWLPNPLFWVGVACLVVDHGRRPLLTGLITGLVGVAGVICGSIWMSDHLWGFNEQSFSFWPGLMSLPGYYAWLASLASLAGLGIARALRRRTWGFPTPTHAQPQQ